MQARTRIATNFPGRGSTHDYTKRKYRGIEITGDSYEAAHFSGTWTEAAAANRATVGASVEVHNATLTRETSTHDHS